MSVIHSARTWAATPKMQPSFNPAGYMLVEGNQYASLQCTFWQIPLRIPGNECMFIDSLDFRPEILSPWFYKLLSGNCSASLRGCKAPWKIIEMKSIKICKLLLLFLSASSPRVWSVQRQRQAAFMSTAIMFQHGVLSYMRTMALGKFFFLIVLNFQSFIPSSLTSFYPSFHSYPSRLKKCLNLEAVAKVCSSKTNRQYYS